MSRANPTNAGGSPAIRVIASSTGNSEPSFRRPVSAMRRPRTGPSPVSRYFASPRRCDSLSDGGTIVSARVLPITSSRRYPNVRSAAGLKSTIRPWWSIAMTLSRAVSRMAARRASLSRRVNVHWGSRTGRALRSRARGRFFDDTRDIASTRGAGALPARRPAIAHVPIYRVRENCSLFLLGLGTRGFGEPAAPDDKRKEGGGRPRSPPTRLLLSPHHGRDGPDHHEREDCHDDRRGIQARDHPGLDRPDALLGDHGRAPGAVRMAGRRDRRDDAELRPRPDVRGERRREFALDIRRAGRGGDFPPESDDIEADRGSGDGRSTGRHRNRDRG